MAYKALVSLETSVDNQFWLNAATASIRDFCGWHVAPKITETFTVDGTGGRSVLLRTKHLTELHEVISDGADITSGVDASESGVLTFRQGRFSNRNSGITVRITHGYEAEEVPNVVAMILAIAKRGAAGPGIVGSKSVNGASVSYLTAGGAPISIPLLEIEKSALSKFQLNWGG